MRQTIAWDLPQQPTFIEDEKSDFLNRVFLQPR